MAEHSAYASWRILLAGTTKRVPMQKHIHDHLLQYMALSSAESHIFSLLCLQKCSAQAAKI